MRANRDGQRPMRRRQGGRVVILAKEAEQADMLVPFDKDGTLVARSPLEMDDFDIRHEQDIPPRKTRAQAQIEILPVHEVGFIE